METRSVIAQPQTYYLCRAVRGIEVVANGYQVTVTMPTIQYDNEPTETGVFMPKPFRVWGLCRLVYASYDEVEVFLRDYFTCSQEDLDAMADRYYRHDITGEADRQHRAE